jgi:hypothetical protein
MIAVRMSVLAVASSLLGGCAVLDYLEGPQPGCRESTQTFAEMAGCLKGEVDRSYTPRPAYSPEVSLYFSKASYLADRVNANLISDYEGRIELQKAYVALRDGTSLK